MKLSLRNILLMFLIVILVTFSCTGRKKKSAHRDIIPEKDLISVLTDVYMADGLLSLPKINKNYAGKDSVTAFKKVIEQHGYTKAQLDRTIRYYFIQKPKRFTKIYDKVLGRLSELQSRIDKEFPVPRPELGNLWQGKVSFSIPSVNGQEKPEVNFQVPSSGLYTLKFTLTLFPDDQHSDPHLDMFIYSADTASSIQKHYFPSLPFLKDGLPHLYKSTVTIRNPGKRQFIEGWFVSSKCHAPDTSEHLDIENIFLSRSPIE